ncbi:MAG: DUF1801 domain-containing protein [Rubrobacteraceae bacterium]
MVKSNAETPEAYIAELPPERQRAIYAVRNIVLENLPEGYEEGMQHGMIGYYIPLERYPDTYNKQPLSIATLGSQKNHMVLHLMGVYSDPETERWFKERFAESGKKLDMGKSCLRFKKLEDMPLEVIGEAISRTPPEKFIEQYEAARAR